ncbi:MAG: hypothetical protein WCT28_01105 [Patescibacteria group bacterium]|jgi:hypothetical protein
MSLQTIVQNAPLAADVKKMLLDRIASEGETPELTEDVKVALQDYIDAGFKTLGVELDPNDPKVQAVATELNEELDAVEEEYNEELENLNIDAAVAQAKGNRDIDGLEADAFKAKMAA